MCRSRFFCRFADRLRRKSDCFKGTQSFASPKLVVFGARRRQSTGLPTISDFRKIHLDALQNLFEQVLKLALTAGAIKLGRVALDGTKIKANASKHKAMSYKRMCEIWCQAPIAPSAVSLIAMRLLLLPYDFTALAEIVNRYVSELQKLIADKQEDARERNRQLEEGVFAATMDPKNKTIHP